MAGRRSLVRRGMKGALRSLRAATSAQASSGAASQAATPQPISRTLVGGAKKVNRSLRKGARYAANKITPKFVAKQDVAAMDAAGPVAPEPVIPKPNTAGAANLRARAGAAGVDTSPIHTVAGADPIGSYTAPPTGPSPAEARAAAQAKFAAEPPGRYSLKKAGSFSRRAMGDVLPFVAADMAGRYAINRTLHGGGKANSDVVNSVVSGIKGLPKSIQSYGKRLLAHPVDTLGRTAASIGDTAANAGITAGTLIEPALVPGHYINNLRATNAANQSLRSPLTRAYNYLFGAPGDSPQPAATPNTGLRVAASQQVFAAPRRPLVAPGTGARVSPPPPPAPPPLKLDTGFSVLRNAGVGAQGNIGDIAAYNAATHIAKQSNANKQVVRAATVASQATQNTAQGQAITNALNLGRLRLANSTVASTQRAEVQQVGAQARTILQNYNNYKASGDTANANAAAEATINQALQTAWNPLSPDSVAAGQMLSDQMKQAADKGLLSRFYAAVANPDFSARDILNNSNGTIDFNRNTIKRLSITPHGTVVLSMPKRAHNGRVVMTPVPLFALSDIPDSFRKQLEAITYKEQQRTTLRSR